MISNTCLADYPTLGLDANALYIGTNNFCGSPSQTFNSTADGSTYTTARDFAAFLAAMDNPPAALAPHFARIVRQR